jgi:hypothetical protein
MKRIPIEKYIYFGGSKLRAFISGLRPAALRGRISAPKVLINSIPKAGTHLLESTLVNFPMLRKNVQRTLRGWDSVDEHTIEKLRTLKRGQFVTAHLPAHQELLDLVEQEDIKVLLVVRDPRDVAVSKVKYITEVNLTHPSHDYFASLPNDDERLLAAINGVKDRETAIGEVFRMFQGWIGQRNVLMVRFEDLIGERGGGSHEAQQRCIKSITAHLDITLSDEVIVRIADGAFSIKSPTFRKGRLGEWKSQFKSAHLKAFKESSKLISDKFGYDMTSDSSLRKVESSIGNNPDNECGRETKPNFIIIGASKAATTSMYYYLKQHPDVYFPASKELHYFTYDKVAKNSSGPGDRAVLQTLCRSRDEYKAHYGAVSGEGAIGEVSPTYFYFSNISERLLSELGNIRIIIMLRNPIEKAFSQYMHLVREGRERLSFYDALMSEEKRMANGWGDMWRYKESCLYSERVEKYIKVFNRKNVHIILFDDLKTNAACVLRKTFTFLGVDPDFRPDTSKVYNKTGMPRSRFIADLISKPSILKKIVRTTLPSSLRMKLRLSLTNMNTGKKCEIDSKSRKYLNKYFDDDILKLEKILQIHTGWHDE